MINLMNSHKKTKYESLGLRILNVLIIFILIFPKLLVGQTTTTYYKDLESILSPEVPKEQAKYSRSVTNNNDGTKTFEVFDIIKNERISSKTYLYGEPYGIWKLKNASNLVELDYNFKLLYINKKEELCADSTFKKQIGNYLKDNESQGYKAPKMENNGNLFQEITDKFIYPENLSEFSISGKTYVQFEINESGEVQNIYIRGKNNLIELDKEAVRVVRNIRFAEPAMFNGKPINICLTLPFGFQ
jgi:TonB family protein